MASIPLDLQRRFEQRWAARFCRPDPNPPKTQELEPQDQQQAATAKAKRKIRRVRRAEIRSVIAEGARDQALRLPSEPFARSSLYREREDAELNEQNGASDNDSKKNFIQGKGLDPHVSLVRPCKPRGENNSGY